MWVLTSPGITTAPSIVERTVRAITDEGLRVAGMCVARLDPGVEIEGTEDRICSWSRVNARLKKITWRSAGDSLVHDAFDWIDR